LILEHRAMQALKFGTKAEASVVLSSRAMLLSRVYPHIFWNVSPPGPPSTDGGT
jgi:hypothetical protein